jgi:outer membrane receptor protein involved in Fe transport
MKNYLLIFLISFLGLSQVAFAQTTITGSIKDGDGEALIGANISIKGTVTGTVTDVKGAFSLTTNTSPPFTLVFSSVGFATKELEISGSQSNLEMVLEETNLLGQEVVVSASRVEESIMRSPVTVEKMDIIAIRQTPSPDFYDGIAKLKGVSSQSGSLTFTSINTRGFATIANTRFVQLIDGMDNSAPLLNFPTGNIVGISELDVESVELVPGAASALYGPNAFNGILFMNSKSPFEYQGLSANAKFGFTSSNQAESDDATPHGTNPYSSFSIRYAKALFNDRFAFKLNFSVLDASDWRANRYDTYRTTLTTLGNESNPNSRTDPAFDGLNSYGDEFRIPFNFGVPANALAVANGIITNPAFASSPLAALGPGAQGVIANALQTLGNVNLPTVGFREQDLLDNNNARSVKFDAALHYRINNNLELIYNYRYGTGSSVYQGGERYALRDFSIQFNKLELRGKNFFVRAYASQTDDGDSYNMTALGTFMNVRSASTYVGTYASALLPRLLNIIPDGQGATPTESDILLASQAVRNVLQPGTPAFNTLLESVRTDLFNRTPAGAGFDDNSRLYHAEFNYNFAEIIKPVEFQVGGNVRRYDLFSNGTIFLENRGGSEFERITIDEFGFYGQVAKSLADDRLKLTASLRFDKNQNFDGQVTPRVSAVYSVGANRQHNFRTSFQTGFRNPDTQAQFIFFPSSAGILLGSTRANAEPFGIHEGGAYSVASVIAFQASGNPADLVTVNLPYLSPEKLSVFEIGYKGIIGKRMLIDANFYRSSYEDFITGQTVLSKEAVTTNVGSFPAFTAFRPYVNASETITSMGIGLGLTIQLPKGYNLTGNYDWATFNADLPVGSEQEIQFNTPENKFNIGISNREVVKNVGFDLSYRWQQGFTWESSFAHGPVEAYGLLDAQVSYKIKSIKTMLKAGGTNLLGNDYYTNFGGPWVGSLYYISITFDEFLR